MRIVFSFLFIFLTLTAGAQHSVAELFKTMPDSLMPLFTQNNRLDMIDFMDAKMKALVTNKLDGGSEMTLLTIDSLVVQVSSRQTMRLLLVNTPVAYDSCQQVLRMENTYQLSSPDQAETVVRYFSVKWHPLDNQLFAEPRPNKSSILKQDEQVFDEKPLL